MKIDRLTLVAMVAFSAVSTDLYLSGIPLLVAEFGATEGEGQLTLGIFMAGVAFGQIIYGPLSDHYGRKPVLYTGLALYILFSLACALSMNIEQLLAARLFQALAAASGPVLARAIVTDMYQPKEAAKLMALLSAAMALIPAIAPIFGSWILYWFDWRSQFYALMLLGVVVLLGALSIKESHPPTPGTKLSFSNVRKQFLASLKHPVFMGYALVSGSHFGAMFAWITCSSFIVIEQFSVRHEYFGYTFAFVVGGFLTGSFLSSRIVLEKGVLFVVRCGLLVGFLAAALMVLLALTHIESLALVLIAAFGIFMSGGMTLPNAQVSAIAVFPKSRGQASSVFGCIHSGVAAICGFMAAHFYQEGPGSVATVSCIAIAISFVSFLMAQNQTWLFKRHYLEEK